MKTKTKTVRHIRLGNVKATVQEHRVSFSRVYYELTIQPLDEPEFVPADLKDLSLVLLHLAGWAAGRFIKTL